MSFDYSNIKNFELFTEDNHLNFAFSSCNIFDEDENEYTPLFFYDNIPMSKIPFEENAQNNHDLKEIKGMKEIISGKNEIKDYSNYSNKSTNDDEKTKNTLLNKKI